MNFDSENRPIDWPANGREQRLDIIWDLLNKFESKPSYRTRESLLSFVCDNDANQYTSFGKVRFSEYEVELINIIYVRAAQFQINSVIAYLYDLISEATRLQKINSWIQPVIENKDEDCSYRIVPYEDGLLLPLKLYYFAYQKFTVEKDDSFAAKLIAVVNELFSACIKKEGEVNTIAYAFTAMLNDISYMRGNKKERLWEFDREELFALFRLEAKILKANSQSPALRPTRGVLMTQISNYILKSRNNYNQDYICKYLSKNVAEASVENHEIWMRKTENLNDAREQKVIPELFGEEGWIDYSWAKGIDFTPTRTYFVSSFSKTINATEMQSKYGECLYGYKNDRIVDLVGPLMMQTLHKKDDVISDSPMEKFVPAISQVITFDVIYDRDEAKNELTYLFNIINLFDMSDGDKHSFLQDILQYWILSVKDSDWKDERERRYVLFLYDDYDYFETTVEDGFLKEKTSLFLLPDFIMGDNPVKSKIKFQMEAKQNTTMNREYLHCHDCLVQDYDSVHINSVSNVKCPICGSKNIEVIYPN